LDAGDWEVVDYSGNPVPGDPDAVTVLVHQFLDQAGRAQDRAARLSSVHAGNEGKMQGNYAASFESILAGLPAHSAAFGEAYQSCAEALSGFAAELDSIQSQAAEADAAYRAALDEFCSVVPPEFSGTGVWRGWTRRLRWSWPSRWPRRLRIRRSWTGRPRSARTPGRPRMTGRRLSLRSATS
jgi:uncharacterized protein YukE